MHLSGFFANFMKHMVNLFYLFTIRSGYYLFQYVMHEFFHTRDKRNIFRDLPSRYGNVLWSLPLRVFVGAFWLVEAFSKIWGASVWDKATSSWSNVYMLFRGIGKDSWFVGNSVKMPFSWLQTATSGASQSAGDTASAASQFGTPILHKMPGWFEWIMRILLPNAGFAVFMQRLMLFIELGIGLAIMFGLFTWLCSAASAGFIVMFFFTAMLGWGDVWVFPASIALLNGAGRTVGFDYWVVPLLQKWFGRLWYGRSKSVYKDEK
jgi:NADH dehydrogenase